MPEASEVVSDPHNFLLEVWGTAGTPAALALLLAIGLVTWRSRSRRSERYEPHRAGCRRDAAHLAWLRRRFLFALAIGAISLAPLSISAVGGGLLVAAVVVAALWPWISRGDLPLALTAIAAVVLLVNLLAAGGIGFAGVAGSLWLLAALSLTAVQPLQKLPVWGAAAILALCVVLGVGCYAQAYRPMLACTTALAVAERDPIRAEKHLNEAAAADPLSAEPWNRLAGLKWARWLESPAPATFDQVIHDLDEAQIRDPRSAALAAFRGDVAYRAYRQTNTPAQLELAIAAFERSTSLYPTNLLTRAKLALALADAGRKAEAAEQAAESLRLDGATPHADQKLPDELRAQLKALVE